MLNRLVAQRRAPNYLFVDNGSEFSGRLLDLWAYRCKARIDFSRPGKPTDNCYVETFNGSFRDECLNVHCSKRWRMPRRSSRPGAGITMRPGLTWLSMTSRQRHMPVNRALGTPKTSSRIGPKKPSGSREPLSQFTTGPKNQGRSVPAKAGTRWRMRRDTLGSRLRGNDGQFVTHLRKPPQFRPIPPSMATGMHRTTHRDPKILRQSASDIKNGA